MVLVHCALHDKMYSDIFLCSYVVDIRPVNCFSCSHMFLCCTALLNKQFHRVVRSRLEVLRSCALVHIVCAHGAMCMWCSEGQGIDVQWQLPHTHTHKNTAATFLDRLCCLPAAKSHCHRHSHPVSPINNLTRPVSTEIRAGLLCHRRCWGGFWVDELTELRRKEDNKNKLQKNISVKKPNHY